MFGFFYWIFFLTRSCCKRLTSLGFTQLDRGSLNTLSQANKQLHFMINPILYSFIDLRGEEAVQCLDRTLRKWINPWTVKSLEKDGIWKGREKTLIERIKIVS